MAKVTKKCRLCGKTYEVCLPPFMEVNTHRWQDVACCVEHGIDYFAMIEASRSKACAPAIIEPEVSNDNADHGNDVDDITDNTNNTSQKKKQKK